MKKIELACLLLILTCCGTNSALANVLTFDDVATDPDSTWEAIPNGYRGLNWNHFWVVAPQLDLSLDPSQGWQNGLVSGDFLAYNQTGAPAEVSSGSVFNFDGASVNAAYRDGLRLTATGFRNGVQLYQTTLELDTGLSQFFAFNFSGIDTLRFATDGGVPAEGWNGAHFTLENFTFTAAPVPVPGAVWLFGTGLAGYAGMARRRRHAVA